MNNKQNQYKLSYEKNKNLYKTQTAILYTQI